MPSRPSLYRTLAAAPLLAVALLAGAVLAGAAVGGCTPGRSETDEQPHAAAAPAELTLLVVDDPPMADAIEQLRAEWKARTGTTIVVERTDADALVKGESLAAAADAVIYPARLLGTLTERGWITPLPQSFHENSELDWGDTFELLQLVETNWAGTPHAVSFGSPVLVLYYRPDLLAQVHKHPPRSWEELHELAELLAKSHPTPGTDQSGDWWPLVQPLGEGWGARVLLARAASYAKHPDHYSTLFDIETMEPLIAGAGFVRALEELVSDAKLGPANQSALDPTAAKDAFLSGRAALALAWPAHAAATQKPAAPLPDTGFAELPGAAVVYNFVHKSWEKRDAEENWPVPLVGLAGRLGSIAAGSSATPHAFQLLAWLSGREWGTQVASASAATTLYRRSQIRQPIPWVDRGTDAEVATVYATTVHDVLNRQQYLSAPRIPGEAQYMEALDRGVRQAVAGEKSAADALQEAAGQWREITEQLGQEAQRKAYRRSLGL